MDITFRLYDGTDIGPFSYSSASTVDMLKQRVVSDWPKGLTCHLFFLLCFATVCLFFFFCQIDCVCNCEFWGLFGWLCQYECEFFVWTKRILAAWESIC